MKTLFVNPPSFDEKFDGGASARYQATREITSFWYPVWLAYQAGLVRDSRLLDEPAQGTGLKTRETPIILGCFLESFRSFPSSRISHIYASKS
jgi:hypothetical protein